MDNHHILVISENDKLARESLAKLIKDLRGNATQREFARLLGTSYTAVQDWEKQIRLPNDKNLKRIAELKGWTQEELVRYIFRTDPQFEIEGVDPVEHIIAQTRNLSLAQMQQLLEHLNTQFVEIQKVQEQKVQEQVVGYCLSDKQKHNLHLLLQASLKNQNLMEAMTQSEIEPELFTDVF
ncbi:MAG: helix-turn-helix transcriptional regulator [Cyanobacteria bacterium CRU_2_1]|nr:helix-turn-helix transcriptional regulator [Cyanobacteria bacterium CRU_2_1]